MTKQEADFIGSMNMCDEISNEAYKKIMCNCEVEEQQPCEDCVSRKELLSRIDAERRHLLDIGMDGAEHIIVHHARRIIEDMPSVTPQQRVYDCDFGQEQFEKRRFLNEYLRKWLSSFNTESATVCFTAVQELKKRLEK